MLIINRAVGKKLVSVFEKPADEEPSRLYGGLTMALGAVAMAGGVLLNHEVFDPQGFDYAAIGGGFYVFMRGLIEVANTID